MQWRFVLGYACVFVCVWIQLHYKSNFKQFLFAQTKQCVYLIPAYRFYRLHLRTSKLGDALGISRTCRHLLNKKKVPIQRLPHNACCVMRQNIQNIRNWCWCFEKSTVCLFFSVLVMENGHQYWSEKLKKGVSFYRKMLSYGVHSVRSKWFCRNRNSIVNVCGWN